MTELYIEKADTRVIKLNSLSIALMLIINYISAIININGGIIIIISIIITLQLYANRKKCINLRVLTFISLILLCFAISLLIVDNRNYTLDYLSKFIAFGSLPLYLGSLNFNDRTMYRTVALISFFTIPLLYAQDYSNFSSENKMGLSYALLPIFIFSIINLKDNSIIRIMSIVVLISTTQVLIDISSRGVLVALIVFMIGYLYIMKFKGTIRQIVFIIFSLYALNTIILKFWDLLTKIQEVLFKINISIYPLNKTILYQKQDKLLNTRDIIWGNAIDGISNNVLFGHGIGTYENLYHTYTHNIFLQTLWEGGVVFFIPISLIALYILIKIIKNQNIQNSILLLFLLSCSYISLLFSSTLWMNQSLWFSIGLILTKNIEKKRGGL